MIVLEFVAVLQALSLLGKLRAYEARHRRCAPGTPLYARSVEQLWSGRIANEAGEESCRCSYIVWLPFDGLGNRMLSMVIGFLYALLTGGGRGGDSWDGGGDMNRRGRTGRATRLGWDE